MSIKIFGHKNPDMDSIASTIALKYYMENTYDNDYVSIKLR
ncbi:MAG: DHH family phosphoesterase [Clostridia bacterium]